MARIFIDTDEVTALAQRTLEQARRVGDTSVGLRRASTTTFRSPAAGAAVGRLAAMLPRLRSLGARIEDLSSVLRQRSASATASQQAVLPFTGLRTGTVSNAGGAGWLSAGTPAAASGGLWSLLNGLSTTSRTGTPPLLTGILGGIPFQNINDFALRTSAAIGVQNAMRGRTSLFSGGTMAQFNNTFANNVVNRFGGGSLSFGSQVGWALSLLGPQGRSTPRISTGLFSGPTKFLRPSQSIFANMSSRNSVGALLTRPSGSGGGL